MPGDVPHRSPEELRREAAAALTVLADTLRALRDATPLTLQKLSRATNISVSSLSRYFTGQALPAQETVEILGELCAGDVAHLRVLWEAAAAARRRLRSVTNAVTGEIPAAAAPATDDEDVPSLAGQLWRPFRLPENPFRRRAVRYSALAVAVAGLMTLTGLTVHTLTVANASVAGGTPLAARPAPIALPSPTPGHTPRPSSVPAVIPDAARSVPPPAPSPARERQQSGGSHQPSPTSVASRPQAPPVSAKPKPVPSAPAHPDPGPTATGATVSLVSTTDPVNPFVVDVDNWSTVSGAPLHLWSWRDDIENNIRTQIWEREVFAAQADQAAVQRFRDLYNGLCLARGGLSNGAPVFQSACDSSAAQRWYSDGGGRLRSAADDRCLDIRDGLTQGSGLQMWDCESPRQQGWKFTPRTKY